jgi:methylated-DNA-[protein]-cysteine S-methyltransferase
MNITKKLVDVKAIRAVATAKGKNPLWIVVPCHRVIGTGGSLAGYAGGLWRKKWLLEHEDPPTQQSFF